MNRERIHLSVDDVIYTLRYIKEKEPNSIFDLEFYKMLKF